MNKEQFESCPKETQDLIFNEMCELYALINNYPISINELKIFTEWHIRTGKFGEELKNMLIGLCPSDELNGKLDKEKLEELLKKSNDTLKLVSFWNRVVQYEVGRR